MPYLLGRHKVKDDADGYPIYAENAATPRRP